MGEVIKSKVQRDVTKIWVPGSGPWLGDTSLSLCSQGEDRDAAKPGWLTARDSDGDERGNCKGRFGVHLYEVDVRKLKDFSLFTAEVFRGIHKGWSSKWAIEMAAQCEGAY